ncbi:MAG: tetratricopeptide repeat protein [Actinomycetota bacterium]
MPCGIAWQARHGASTSLGVPDGFPAYLSGPAARLLIGVSVFREPASRNALLFQLGEQATGTPPAATSQHPAPPYQPPANLAELVSECEATSLLIVPRVPRGLGRGDTEIPPVFVDRRVASMLHKDLLGAGRGDEVVRAHERAADYWQWRAAAWPQNQDADLHDLLEARHHRHEAGDNRQAGVLTEIVCAQLHAWGELDREAALIQEILAWLPARSPLRANWIQEIGKIAQVRGNYAEAERRYQQSLDIFASVGDAPAVSRSQHHLGVLAQAQGDYGEAERRYRQSGNVTGPAGPAVTNGGWSGLSAPVGPAMQTARPEPAATGHSAGTPGHAGAPGQPAQFDQTTQTQPAPSAQPGLAAPEDRPGTQNRLGTPSRTGAPSRPGSSGRPGSGRSGPSGRPGSPSRLGAHGKSGVGGKPAAAGRPAALSKSGPLSKAGVLSRPGSPGTPGQHDWLGLPGQLDVQAGPGPVDSAGQLAIPGKIVSLPSSGNGYGHGDLLGAERSIPANGTRPRVRHTAGYPPGPVRRNGRLLGLAATTAAILVAVVAGDLTGFLPGGQPVPVRASEPAAGPPPAAPPPADTAAAARSQAARWAADQLSRGTIISCDPAMCAALRAQHIPGARLERLGPSAPDPLGSDVVMATAAVRSQFGHRLAAVYAPAVQTVVGTGKARIQIRAIAPDGAVVYRHELRADLQKRRSFGAQLLKNPGVSVSAAARRELDAGQVDARLLMTLAFLAHQHPLRISGFVSAGRGASPGVALRTADFSAHGAHGGPARAGQANARFLRSAVVFLRAQRPPFLAQSMHITRVNGQPAEIRVEFGGPSPLGLLASGTSQPESSP